MKKILITGKDSYVGTSVEKWLMREPYKYSVDTIDMRDGSWQKHDFSKYDVVFHVAGIAHISETKENRQLYYEVNRDLAYATARKAKQSNVRHFIFLSSMSVYGITKGRINEATFISPQNAYGESKAEAEKLISSLSEGFIVSIIRPPMIYGPGCKGNYPRLSKLVLRVPVFPLINNKRSMIYIDNFSEYIKQLIDKESGGIHFPQNINYVNTSEMVSLIAEAHHKKIVMTRFFNPILRLLNIDVINKVIGDLVYEMSLSKNADEYQIVSFRESIYNTEKSGEKS